MLENLFQLGAQASSGAIPYSQFQTQQAVTNLQYGLQQALQTANQVKTQAAQQGVTAAQMTLLNFAVSQNAINTHLETIKTTRTIQAFNNQIADRNYNNQIQAATNLQKILVSNSETYSKIIDKTVGDQEAAAVKRGVLASEGRSLDIAKSSIDELEKQSARQQAKDSTNIKQAYENATAIQINKAFSNWDTDTQINFSNKVLQNSMSF